MTGCAPPPPPPRHMLSTYRETDTTWNSFITDRVVEVKTYRRLNYESEMKTSDPVLSCMWLCATGGSVVVILCVWTTCVKRLKTKDFISVFNWCRNIDKNVLFVSSSRPLRMDSPWLLRHLQLKGLVRSYLHRLPLKLLFQEVQLSRCSSYNNRFLLYLYKPDSNTTATMRRKFLLENKLKLKEK